MGAITLNVGFVTETCCVRECSVQWAFTRDYYNSVHSSGAWWYCPNGHRQHYAGPSDAQKLQDAEARELALRDQLSASIREGEITRQALLRDRQRFIQGVCVCCNRSFENVRRHMASQHPDFDVVKIATSRKFQCSCGSAFSTLKGLRVHQGRQRGGDWDVPNQVSWRAHLTRV